MQAMSRVITPLLMVALTLSVATGIDWNADLTWHDQHRVGQVVLLVATALGALTVWRIEAAQAVASLPRWAALLLGLGFGLGLCSVAAASLPRFAALEWATLFLLMVLGLLLAQQARRAVGAFDRWATWLCVALAVVVALKIMMGYLAAIISVGRLDTVLLFEGSFSNRRFFGQAASLLVPLLAYPLLHRGLPGSARTALFVLLATWWMLVIVSGTRGTWMALTVAGGVLALVSWRASAAWLRIQLMALAVGALLFALLFVGLPAWIDQGAVLENRMLNPATLNGRELLWSIAWSQIVAHPWLGVGPMHLASIRNDFGAHPHNAILQLSAEWGVAAASAFMMLAFAGLRSALKRLRLTGTDDSSKRLRVCLAASLLAAGAQSMVDGVIVIPYTQTLLTLVSGYALGLHFRETPVVGRFAVSKGLRLATSLFLLAALLALAYGVFPEILNRAEITQNFVNAGNALVPPRYWAVGWIP